MKKFITSALVLLAFVTVAIPVSLSAVGFGAEEAEENEKRLVAYYTEWSIYDGADNYFPSDINTEYITHINYAFIDIDYVGRDIYEPGNAPQEPEDCLPSAVIYDEYAFEQVYPELMALREDDPDLKIMMSVGGWSRSACFAPIAADEDLRQEFAESLVDLMLLYDFDGIDIDWEYPGVVREGDTDDNASDLGTPWATEEDGANYVLLLEDIRRELDKAEEETGQYYELTVAVPAGDKAEHLDIDGMALYVDWFNLMTYDLTGAFDTHTGHHAPIYDPVGDPLEHRQDYSAESTVDYYLAHDNVTSDMLVVGSPFYSRGWSGVDMSDGAHGIPGLYQPAEGGAPGDLDGGAPAGQNKYSTIVELREQDGWEEYTDPYTMTPVLVNEELGILYTYENEESARARAEYVNDNDLGGIIVWDLALDGNAKPEPSEPDICWNSEYAQSPGYVGGDIVHHQGGIYEAKWDPAGDDEPGYPVEGSSAWERIGDSDEDCGGEYVPRCWSPTIQYSGGDLVAWDGYIWEAVYWNEGVEPGTPDEGGGYPWVNTGEETEVSCGLVATDEFEDAMDTYIHGLLLTAIGETLFPEE